MNKSTSKHRKGKQKSVWSSIYLHKLTFLIITGIWIKSSSFSKISNSNLRRTLWKVFLGKSVIYIYSVVSYSKGQGRPYQKRISQVPCSSGLWLFIVGQNPIPIDYGQPLFFWLSRDWPSVRTYASTVCTGRVGETIKRKGGVSQACLAKSTSFTLDIHNMVNWQLSKQDSHWPVSHGHIAGSCVNTLRWRDLFGSCPLTS